MNNIMDILNIPFGYVLKFCNLIIPNYAIALLLFALIMKVILFPLGIKQQKSQIKQAKLRPKEMAIRKRYAGRDDKPTKDKMQQEIMDLYQKENYNPAGGCLPLLLQFPIIISLYNVIRNPLTYILRIGDSVQGIKDQLTSMGLLELAENGIHTVVSTGTKVGCELDFIQLIRDNFDALSGVMGGVTVDKLPDFKIFGGWLDLSMIPQISNPSWLLLVPVLTFAFSFLSMKLTRKFTYQPPVEDGAAGGGLSMKIMDLTMPLMSVYITFIVPAVIGIYWIYQNILGVVQQYILSKMYPIPVFTEEDYRKAEKEMNGSVRKEKKKEPVHSLHHIDDEEAKAAEKQLQQKQQKGAAALIDKPVLKEERDGSAPVEKKSDGNANKPRSLHHIDDDDYNGSYDRPLKTEVKNVKTDETTETKEADTDSNDDNKEEK